MRGAKGIGSQSEGACDCALLWDEGVDDGLTGLPDQPALVQHTDDFAYFGELAQLGERLVCNQEVTGSSPVFSTRFCEPVRGFAHDCWRSS